MFEECPSILTMLMGVELVVVVGDWLQQAVVTSEDPVRKTSGRGV
jgi:hypothetical protein